MSIPTPPGPAAPGGVTPPGGETPPGGRGTPGEERPSAPLGRPPRIHLRPLGKRGGKTTQKVVVRPTRAAQLRQAIGTNRANHQQQMHAHIQQHMPQLQQKNQPAGNQAPPQQAGMGQKGAAHKQQQQQAKKAKKQAPQQGPIHAGPAQTPPAPSEAYKPSGAEFAAPVKEIDEKQQEGMTLSQMQVARENARRNYLAETDPATKKSWLEDVDRWDKFIQEEKKRQQP